MDAVRAVSPDFRTNVRFLNAILRLLRFLFRLSSRVAPGATARVAERLWFTPPRLPLSARGRATLETGTPFTVRHPEGEVAAWEWGWGRGPTVILFHGWGGRAAQMGEFVAPLLAAGHRVVAFDAPGHGVSPRGSRSPWRQADFFEFAGALRAVAWETGPVHGLIAHSGGVTAATRALREGLRVRRAVFLAPMTDPLRYTRVFAGALGFSDEVIARFRARAARRIGFRWEDLNVAAAAAHMEVPRTLVFHDREDAETPPDEGEAIARHWPGARLVLTQGLGHRKLLRDPAVIAQAVAFLKSAQPERSIAPPDARAA